jgi:hypothetical protein
VLDYDSYGEMFCNLMTLFFCTYFTEYIYTDYSQLRSHPPCVPLYLTLLIVTMHNSFEKQNIIHRDVSYSRLFLGTSPT